MLDMNTYTEEQPGINKKEVKHTVNKIIGGVLIYEILMFFITLLYMTILIIPAIINSKNTAESDAIIDDTLDRMLSSGTYYIIAIIIGVFILWLYFHRPSLKNIIIQTNKKMSAKSFMMLLCIFMSAQLIFTLLGIGIEATLNHFGLSIMSQIESASSGSTTLSMLLYASFLGPITEEIVFRGFVLNGLKKYGKHFAIIVSAIAFGAYHGNLIQGVFATFIGLVFAYIAMEYSLKWAIVMHIINNFIFGDLFVYLTSGFSEMIQSIIFYVMEGAFFIAALIIMIFKRNSLSFYLKSEKTEKGLYRFAFTSICMIIFLLLQLLIGLDGIESI